MFWFLQLKAAARRCCFIIFSVQVLNKADCFPAVFTQWRDLCNLKSFCYILSESFYSAVFTKEKKILLISAY